MLRNSEKKDLSNSGDWYDAAMYVEKPTKLSGTIFFLLCVILIFSPLAYGSTDAWALGIVAILVFAVGIIWLYDSWRTSEFCFSTSVLQLPFVGLILVGLIQLLPLRATANVDGLISVSSVSSLTVDPYATRFAVVLLILNLVFFAASLTFVNNQSRLRKMVLLIIIFGALLSFFGILQSLTATEQSIFGVRTVQNALPFATFVNRHHFASMMVMTGGLTLGLLYNQATKKDKVLLLIIAIVTMGLGLVLTSSRGGWISFLGVIFFVTAANIFLKRNESKNSEKSFVSQYFGLIGGGIALIVGIIGIILLLGGDESLLRYVGMGNEQEISNGRFHFWSVSLQIIKDYPILGAGLDAFGTVFPNYDTWHGLFRIEQAHNDYLQIFADAGIFGLLLALSFIFFLFKNSLAQIRQISDRFRRGTAIGALAGCFGILIHSFFDFPLRTTSNMFYFLMLATLATVTIHYPKLYRKA